ncbi:MAG: DUF4389 domain-containing protein [Actinobacteria bacterium]|nr:DUF4389 domain-containing protein [Thermoleophilia bacterium]MCB9010201.1 DUF4389 domain-containing protein [Actinomycetota bacterium]
MANSTYAARLSIDYPDRQLDRLSTALRIFFVIPIAIVATLLSNSDASWGGALFLPVLLMVLFRRKYPRWWFDFELQLSRFTSRVSAYSALMSDRYPATDDDQYVHLELDYPDVERDLNRWLPLVKWFLAIPHYIVLIVLSIGAFFATIFAWFAILFTGRYPRGLFDYVEGVMRWWLRVSAYAFLLITDAYPPFSLKA